MKKLTCFLLIFIGLNPHIFSQENFVDLIITLQNKNGGYFKNQTINITSKSNGRTFKLSSDNQGKAHFVLPTKDIYDITISNYTKKKEEILKAKLEEGDSLEVDYNKTEDAIVVNAKKGKAKKTAE